MKLIKVDTLLLLFFAALLVINCKNSDEDFSEEVEGGMPTRDSNLAFGNPSNANEDPDNYLLSRPAYTISYNNANGIPNWVSWHLSSAWQGHKGRCNCFAPDTSLPSSFHVITEESYNSSGFQRGHLCASSDRDDSSSENESTYLMSNIVPQTIDHNTGPWVGLEIYLRSLLDTNEVYVLAGGAGTGGTGTRGLKNRIADGLVNVPNSIWKVALILPNGVNDISRVKANTRILAVNIPNNRSVSNDWRRYQTSIDEIELLTGYDFFDNVPDMIENSIESSVSDQ